jgi:hypothetical protein
MTPEQQDSLEYALLAIEDRCEQVIARSISGEAKALARELLKMLGAK